MMINRRRVCGGKSLPYDAEIEYLESSGTQYIDTDIFPYQLVKAEVDVQFTRLLKCSILGSYNGDGENGWNNLIGVNVEMNRFWCQWGTAYNGPFFVDTNRHYHVFERNNDVSWSYKVDNTLYVQNGNVSTQPLSNSRKMFLFACNRNGELYRQSYARIYSCNIYDANGVLIRSFIPVVKDNVGYMYDKVSGRLFGNQGTGNFILGPDKVKLPSGYKQLGYIESTGTQWIDTGIVPANKKIGAVIDFRYTSNGSTTGGVFGSNLSDGIDNIQFTVFTSRWRYKINNFAAFGNTYDTNRHTLSLNMADGTKFDGNVVTSTQYTINPSNTQRCFLGACSYNGSTTPAANERYALIGRIYSAKVYDDTTLVRDFIPVRKGNVGYMYDKVSKQPFGNSGTGSFILGPDKVKLPSGYRQLEYIEGTGTQYIDTNFMFTENKGRVDIEYIQTRDEGSNRLFGYWITNNGNSLALRLDNCFYRLWVGSTELYKDNSIASTINVKHSVSNVFDNGNCTITFDGVEHTNTYTASIAQSNQTCYLFSMRYDVLTTWGTISAKMYSCKIYDGDTLARNYIPVKRNSDNVVGMYDLVNNTFYTNAGTGTFIAGPDV